MSTSRHFKALMRKNWINWKRTPVGSLIEAFCPSLLMLVLVYLRIAMPAETMGDGSFSGLKHLLFSVTQFDPISKQYVMNMVNILDVKENTANFTRFANYSLDNSDSDYVPMIDPLGPYLFYPPHCFQPAGSKFNNSTVIAIVLNDNSLEQDIQQMLDSIFTNQIELGKQLSTGKLDLAEIMSENGKKVQGKSTLLGGSSQGVGGKISFPNKKFDFKTFKSNEELFSYVSRRDYGNTEESASVCFGLSLLEHANDKYELELFFNDQFVLQLKSIPSQKNPSAQSFQFLPQLVEYSQYQWFGFAYLQNWVANLLLKKKTGNEFAHIMTMVVPQKSQPFIRDDVMGLLTNFCTLFVFLMYIPLLYRTVYRIVSEKETRAKESMRMMGLQDRSYWLSWIVYYSIVNFAISVSVTLVLRYGVLKFTDGSVIWAVIFMFGESLFGLILTVQSVFTKSRQAAIFTTLVYFGLNILQPLVLDDNTSASLRFWVSFSPMLAMEQSMKALIMYEQSGNGYNLSNLDKEYRNYSMRTGLLMEFACFVSLTAFGLYLEKVLPKNYGKKEHPLFFFMPDFWRRVCKKSQPMLSEREMQNRINFLKENHQDSPNNSPLKGGGNEFLVENMNFETKFIDPRFYEGVPYEMWRKDAKKSYLKVQNLRKEYENGFKAVNGINLKIYSDKIFVLLGHNGAGKSTTISILTGLFGASEGVAEVFGFDLFNDLDNVRRFLGICPQHDVLFELLTPEEHLSIFYDFKGANPDQNVKQAEINKLLKDVGVDDKRNSMAYTLSGGNQRKLSIAIALCGGSKFVLLDEPTAGLDLSARRAIWNMLAEQKKGRIIILTTHYMDEADILGDRIGIMTAGRLTCLGTSMFLKNTFGVGYILTLQKQSPEPNTNVMPFMFKHLGKKVKKMGEIQSELTFLVPTQYSSKFKQFFALFEAELPNFGILTYGISVSTLEEVFLKVGHLENPGLALHEEEQSDSASVSKQDSSMFDGQLPKRTQTDFFQDLNSKKRPALSLYGIANQNIQQQMQIFKDEQLGDSSSQNKDKLAQKEENKSFKVQQIETPLKLAKFLPPIKTDTSIKTMGFLRAPVQSNNLFQSSEQQANERLFLSPKLEIIPEQEQMVQVSDTETEKADFQHSILRTEEEGAFILSRKPEELDIENSGFLSKDKGAKAISSDSKPNTEIDPYQDFKDEAGSPPVLDSLLQKSKFGASEMWNKAKRSLSEQVIPSQAFAKQKLWQQLQKEEADKKKREKYSLLTAPLDTSFWYQFKAVLFKRFSIYRRSKKEIFVETFVPSLLVIFGFSFTKVNFISQSPSRILGPDRLPGPQKVLFNRIPVDRNNSDVSVSAFASHFDRESFEIFYSNSTSSNQPRNNSDFYKFGSDVYDFGKSFQSEEPFHYGSYQIYQANRQKQQYKFFSFVNLTSQDSSALYPQFMYESILKVATNNSDFEFKVRNSPLPPDNKVFRYKSGVNAATIIFFVSVSYAMMLTSVVSYLVLEKQHRLKHIQVITGMKLKAYWTGNFVFDFCKLQVTVITTLLMFEAFSLEYETAWTTFIMFPFGILPFTYVTSLLFNVDSAAQTCTMFLHFCAICIGGPMIFTLRLNKSMEVFADYFHMIAKIIPSYGLSSSVMFDSAGKSLSLVRERSDGLGEPISSIAWSFPNVAGDFTFMIIHGIAWTIVLILLESDQLKRFLGVFQGCKRSSTLISTSELKLDDDVQTEADRILRTPEASFQISVRELRKVYMVGSGACRPGKPMLAVERLSFGLNSGECFALLGVNGAGKSTTFKSLTCEIEPTSGAITIGGYDVQRHFNKVKRLIGYCPQHNCIFPSMTVEDHVDYYSRLKGIRPQDRQVLMDGVLQELHLESQRRKLAGDLSGGNKRKLCVAMAIIGSPSIILLDEPSAGMDPEARRFMWSVVAKIASEKTSAVVLTTHSMEEAEALSTKMGIMVKGGVFKCFGSSQHIKNKFGTGYVIDIKIRLPTPQELRKLASEVLPLPCGQFEGKDMIAVREIERQLKNVRMSEFLISTFMGELANEMQGETKAQSMLLLKTAELPLMNIATMLFQQQAMVGVIETLCSIFGKVEQLEKYGGFISLRVERQDKTIGQVFGLVEDLKTKNNVQDYSVSQTTLEQIFQSFANLKFTENSTTYQLDKQNELQIV